MDLSLLLLYDDKIAHESLFGSKLTTDDNRTQSWSQSFISSTISSCLFAAMIGHNSHPSFFILFMSAFPRLNL